MLSLNEILELSFVPVSKQRYKETAKERRERNEMVIKDRTKKAGK